MFSVGLILASLLGTKPYRRGLAICLVLAMGLFADPPIVSADPKSAESDQCVACHTKARRLIEISRLIRKDRPAPKKSEKTKGKG